MELLLVAVLAFALGVVVGAVIAGRWLGRTLKIEMRAGRLTRDEATRIADLPGARS